MSSLLTNLAIAGLLIGSSVGAHATVQSVFFQRAVGHVQDLNGIRPGGTSFDVRIFPVGSAAVQAATMILPNGSTVPFVINGTSAGYAAFPGSAAGLFAAFPTGSYGFNVTTSTGTQQFNLAFDAGRVPSQVPQITNLAALTRPGSQVDRAITLVPLANAGEQGPPSMLFRRDGIAGETLSINNPALFAAGRLPLPNGFLQPGNSYGLQTAYRSSVFTNQAGIQVLQSTTYSTGSVFSIPAAPGVPEPASWALMLSGFGLVGFGLRRRRIEALLPL